MSTIGSIYVATSADAVTIADVKSRVLAVGVGLFFAFVVIYNII